MTTQTTPTFGTMTTETNVLKVGQIVYWKTMFSEYFKGEITGLSADTVTVTRLVPYVAYGVTIKRSDVC